jgi:hypothetical protein
MDEQTHETPTLDVMPTRRGRTTLKQAVSARQVDRMEREIVTLLRCCNSIAVSSPSKVELLRQGLTRLLASVRRWETR